MPRDLVVIKSELHGNLLRAYTAKQGSFFCETFAAKGQLKLTDEQRQIRTQLLRMTSQLIDTEFDEAMEALVKSWEEYKEAK